MQARHGLNLTLPFSQRDFKPLLKTLLPLLEIDVLCIAHGTIPSKE